MAQKIVPNLWCQYNAREVADFYLAAFPGARIVGGSTYPESVEAGLADFQESFAGKDLTIDIELYDYRFTLINAGSEFSPTPAISFFVNFDPSRDEQAREHLEKLWEKLLDGGKALMPLQEYPFSKYYGWVQDKFGVSWQLILTNPYGEPRPMIVPSLMFVNEKAGTAERAMEHYIATFPDSRLGTVARHEAAMAPVKQGDIMFADFALTGEWFAAMDAPMQHDFDFTEGISLAVSCEDQVEIDRLWAALSAHPENEQCGWCKDEFGVSWQIVPENIEELMQKPDAFKTMMGQKKIVIAEY